MITRFFLENFKDQIDFIIKIFEDLPINLRLIKSNLSAEQYIAKGFEISTFIFIFLQLSLISLISLITGNLMFGITSSLIISTLTSVGFFFIYLKIPSLQLSSLQSKIEKEMYHYIPVFSAFVSDKTPLEESIKSFVTANPDLKLSKELDEIYKMVKFGGLDIVTAIDKKIEVTPSKKLRDFLFGLLTIIKTGGSLKEYVKKVAEDEIEEYKNKIRESSRKLTLFFEIYLISLVIGSLFLIIITSVFSLIQPIPNLLEMQFLIVFFLIPLVSIAMSKLLESLTP
jgi:flagellar protein FlaJ